MKSKVLDQVVGLVGFTYAIDLCDRFGGRSLYIPERVTESHVLSLTVGFRNALKLAEAFGGESLVLPTERNAIVVLRNRQIHSESKAGTSVQKLVAKFGLSRKAVAKIIAKLDAEPVAEGE